jgi:hypothetical protein
MTILTNLREQHQQLLDQEAEARAKGDVNKAAELDAEADELGEYIYRKERGGRWDPEEGAWVYPKNSEEYVDGNA